MSLDCTLHSTDLLRGFVRSSSASAWNSQLPVDKATLISNLKASAPYTWTDDASGEERLPINNISWAVAFAFCAWDDGRLPTAAEWNYAAAGPYPYRIYPWGTSVYVYGYHAVFNCVAGGDSNTCSLADILKVGQRPEGNARWQHADMGGSMWEWTLDLYTIPPTPCNGCVIDD